MKYLSTRDFATTPTLWGFRDILLEGLAPDGGLYMPETYPQITADMLQRWYHLSYADLAFEILSLYIDDIPSEDLHTICRKTYTQEIFGTPHITPLTPLENNLFLEGLSNGPTLAFKDIAMQLLGNLFEYELRRRNENLNILGATSGDTGSAAEYAMRGKQGVRVFMLSPQGRMSAFQQAQMFSLQDDNIHNIAIEGVFDDCQDIVKAASNDLDFKRKYKLGTVNSINWARLLAQTVYYVAGYLQVIKEQNALPSPATPLSNWKKVSFTVPTGNFGNVCAGHVARMMGLPIDQLVIATNENDVLDEFFRTGVYRVRTGENTYETSSPSMDISKASNFERFIFDLIGRDATQCKSLFHERIHQEGFFDLGNISQFKNIANIYGIVSGKSCHNDRIQTIRSCKSLYNVVIDPHTADALKVAQQTRNSQIPMIVLETALPIKFSATIVQALGTEPSRPVQFQGIENLPKRVVVLPAQSELVKVYIKEHC